MNDNGETMSDKPKMIDLEVQSAWPLCTGKLGLLLPTDLSLESFEAVKKQIEFRRKCMNQSFDNLLELLEMSRDVLLETSQRQGERESASGV
jgi:hypothetical protein